MAFPRVGSPRFSTVHTPTDFTASGTAHVKGSYQQIISSLSRDMCGLWISSDVIVGTATTNTSMLMDIAVGASGSEVVRVADIPVGYHAQDMPFYLPLHVPAGNELRGRIQAAVVSDIWDPRIVIEYGGRPGAFAGYELADTIGVNTATSAPSTGDLTDNAFDQAIASTARPYRALTLHPCGQGTAMSGADMTIDVAVGAAAAEQVLGSWTVSTTTAELIDRIQGPRFIEAEIPQGSRLSIRKNGTADLSAAIIGWV